MHIAKRIMLAAMVCLTLPALAQQPQILSAGHAMARVEAAKRYILLPVEERQDVARVKLLRGGTLLRQINVRLAVNNADYYVPLDISAYKGQSLLLDVEMAAAKREGGIASYALWGAMSQADTFSTANRERLRPAFHFSPAYGWANDPNGMVYADGTYHLYFQHNPYGSQWENMTWGHATSRDLVSWQQQANAIMPDALGAAFSGSAVVDEGNTAGFGAGAIVAIYTAAGANQTQCLAYSTDGGMTFAKYEGNPVLTADAPDFRDPKVIWNESSKRWNMVVSAGQEVRFYSSSNLKQWRYESSFGQGYGSHGGVWECPDLMRLPVRGTSQQKWLLIVNINPGGPFGGSATQYFTGTWDGHSFTCDSKPETTKWMDYGKDHYAAVTFSGASGGRKIAMAWMSNWQYADRVPTKQFRSSFTLPRELSLYEYGGETYVASEPVEEAQSLREGLVAKISAKPKTCEVANLVGLASGTFEVVVDPSKRNKSGELRISVGNTKGEKVGIVYDYRAGTLTVDRRESGETKFSEAFPAATTAPTFGQLKKIRIIVDRSSIEVFGDDRVAITNLIFPSAAYSWAEVWADGPMRASAAIYKIKQNIK